MAEELFEKLTDGKIKTRKELLDAYEGLSGDNNPNLIFILSKLKNESNELLNLENIIFSKINQIFINEDIEVGDDIYDILFQTLYSFLLEIFDLEDFRTVFRYCLTKAKTDIKNIRDWLIYVLCLEAFILAKSNDDFLTFVRDRFEFFGVQSPSPREIADFATNFGLKDLVDYVSTNERYQFINLVMNRPEYLQEIISGKRFWDIWEKIRLWTKKELGSKILEEFEAKSFSKARELIVGQMSLANTFETLKSVFLEMGLFSNNGVSFPIRVYKSHPLPSVDPLSLDRLEKIPTSMISNILPKVTYSVPNQDVEFVFIGGSEIGRSGVLIRTDNGGVLCDYGLSIVSHGIPRWVPDLEFIDSVIVSHAHLDHCGGLPVLFEKFNGPVLGVPPTKTISMLLIRDCAKLMNAKFGLPYRKTINSLLKKENVDKVEESFVEIDYDKEVEVSPGVFVTPLNAAHIYGSSSLLIKVDETSILYTGDFNLDSTELFKNGSNPHVNADITIFDGTYFGRENFSRIEAEKKLIDATRESDKTVIPVFSVGRAQEIISILEKNGVTKEKNVMLLGMAATVAQLTNLKGKYTILETGKESLEKDDVVVCGGGMLQGGLARSYFLEIRKQPKASLILTGYLAKNTLGREIIEGNVTDIDCKVVYARFSAHSSSKTLSEYVNRCKGQKIMVHTPVRDAGNSILIPNFEERVHIRIGE